jgi:hypothetical protein
VNYEGLAPIQGKNTVVGVTETRIMESVRLSATVSHDIRTRLASLAFSWHIRDRKATLVKVFRS